jgi:hypothetical protein
VFLLDAINGYGVRFWTDKKSACVVGGSLAEIPTRARAKLRREKKKKRRSGGGYLTEGKGTKREDRQMGKLGVVRVQPSPVR